MRSPSLQTRVRQGLLALLPADHDGCAAIVDRALTPSQREAFRRLSHFDRAHLCRVYDALRRSGETDQDVLLAALLHDVGKVGDAARVRLVHRVARVVLRRVAPSVLARLATPPAQGWRSAFVLAVHHPSLGADHAATLGCSARTCWLIAHHEDDPPPDDDALRRLIAADHAA